MGERSSKEKIHKKNLSAFLKDVPKTEVHIHAEAVVSFASYQKLNEKNHINPDLKKPEDFHTYLEMKSLADFIRNFTYLQTFFREPEDFRYMIQDMEAYAQRNNIRYIEAFFAPSIPKKNGLMIQDILTVFDREMKAAEGRGLPIRLIVDVSRTFGLENAQDNLKELLAYLEKKASTTRIIGIGLGGQESGNPASVFKEVFTQAKKSGLHVVAHAGEEVGSESIWSALKDLGAERIGHGTSADFDPELQTYLRDHKIPLEICPTSNVITGKYVQALKDHPLRRFVEKGLQVTINTDDPIFFSVELNEEILNTALALDLTSAQVEEILKAGVEATFLPEAQKTALKNEISTVYSKYFSR